MPALTILCIGVAAAGLLAAALHDLAVRTVPNALVAIVLAAGLCLALAQHRLLASLAVMAALALAAGFLWVRGFMGGADAKLLGASGLLIAPANALPMLVAIAVAGGALCFPYLPGRRLFGRPAPRRPPGLLPRLLRCEHWRLRRRGPLPYAVAIAAGALFVLLHGA